MTPLYRRVRRVVTNMAEHKYKDIIIKASSTNTPANPVTTSFDYFSILDGIVQGQTVNTRIGNRIRVSRVTASFDVKSDTNALMTSLMRMMFVWNNDCNSSAPSFTDMFGPSGSFDHINLQDPVYFSKYKIIRDYMHSMTTIAVSTTNSGTAGPRSNVKFSFPVGKVITYAQNNASTNGKTPANMTKNDCYLAWVGSDSGCCQFEGIVRVYFTDF